MTPNDPRIHRLVDRTPLAATSGNRRVRVAVADDHPAVRLGMHQLIDDQPDMVVVQEARDGEEALRGDARWADVAVLDYHLGGLHDGLWVTRRLKQSPYPPRVLIYSAFADSALAAAAVIAGADGLLGKGSLGEELCQAIRALSQGRHYLPAVAPAVADALASQLRPDDRQIFGMLLAGLEPEEIAERLGLTTSGLDERRSIMLSALAPGSRAFAGTGAPLDYDRPLRHARYHAHRTGTR